MSGPYDHHASHGQAGGLTVGPVGGISSGQLGGTTGGHFAGQTMGVPQGPSGGQFTSHVSSALHGQGGGQVVGGTQGPSTSQFSGQVVGGTQGPSTSQFSGQAVGGTQGPSTSQFSGQIAGASQGQTGGQYTTHTTTQHFSQATTGQRVTDVGQSRQGSSGRPPRQRHDSGAQSSSSSSSDRQYRVTGPGGDGSVSSGAHHQYSSEHVQAYGTTGGSSSNIVEGQRRQARHQRQVIRLPDQTQGQVRQVRRRLPTPEPDVLERVYVQRVGGECIEEITEIPTTPPPRIQERTVVEPAGPPQVIKRVIRVPPRSGGAYQQTGSFAANAGQYNNVTSTASYGSIQQGATSYQPYGTQTSTAVYGTNYGAASGSYGSYGSGYQQQATSSFGGYSSQPVIPRAGVFPATCFYV